MERQEKRSVFFYSNFPLVTHFRAGKKLFFFFVLPADKLEGWSSHIFFFTCFSVHFPDFLLHITLSLQLFALSGQCELIPSKPFISGQLYDENKIPYRATDSTFIVWIPILIQLKSFTFAMILLCLWFIVGILDNMQLWISIWGKFLGI